MLIDTHTHLFVEEFDEDRDLAIQRAIQQGVSRLYLPNIDDESLSALFATCRKHPLHCFPLVGLHPTSVDERWEERLEKVKSALQGAECPIYGIGEVGMDLYWDKTYCEAQKAVLTEQAHWALERDLPLILHCREAHREMVDTLLPFQQSTLRGIFHSFTGTREEAEELLAFPHFMLGINGIVTFKKSPLPNVLPHVPLSRIVLETDSPYLAPVPHRGKRNESSYLPHIAQKLAEIYQVPLSEVIRQTTENALRIFSSEA